MMLSFQNWLVAWYFLNTVICCGLQYYLGYSKKMATTWLNFFVLMWAEGDWQVNVAGKANLYHRFLDFYVPSTAYVTLSWETSPNSQLSISPRDRNSCSRSILVTSFLFSSDLQSLGLNYQIVLFSFRNGIKLLKDGFRYFYPGAEDANVLWNDQSLANWNVSIYRTPAWHTSLSSLLPWTNSDSLANSKPLKLHKITPNLSGPFSQNGCHNA